MVFARDDARAKASAENRQFAFQGPAVGTNVTTGGTLSSLFADSASGNYEPAANSQLLGRLSELLVPCDVNGRKRSVPDRVGANVPAAE